MDRASSTLVWGRETREEVFYLTTHSTHFIALPHHSGQGVQHARLGGGNKGGSVLFNNALDTFHCTPPPQWTGRPARSSGGGKQGRREVFYLTTHSTHFIALPHHSGQGVQHARLGEGNKGGSVLFNNALDTFHCTPPPQWTGHPARSSGGGKQGRKCFI